MTTTAAVDRLYARLASPAAQRLYLLMAAHPGSSFTADAAEAVAVTNPGVPGVARCLRALTAAGLYTLERGRYHASIQVRQHCAARAQRDLVPQERIEALARLSDHYLAGAVEASRVLLPDEPCRPAYRFPLGVAPLEFPTAAMALRWLAEEHLTLIGLQQRGHGFGLHLAHQAVATWIVYRHQGSSDAWEAGQRHGLEAAQAGDAHDLEGVLLRRRGIVLRERGDAASALGALYCAVAASERAEDRHGVATAWRHTGHILCDLKRWEGARMALLHATQIRPHDSSCLALDHAALANLESRWGEHDQAIKRYNTAVGHAATPAHEAKVRHGLARAWRRYGDVRQARVEAQQALSAARAGDLDLMRPEMTALYRTLAALADAAGELGEGARLRRRARAVSMGSTAATGPAARSGAL